MPADHDAGTACFKSRSGASSSWSIALTCPVLQWLCRNCYGIKVQSRPWAGCTVATWATSVLEVTQELQSSSGYQHLGRLGITVHWHCSQCELIQRCYTGMHKHRIDQLWWLALGDSASLWTCTLLCVIMHTTRASTRHHVSSIVQMRSHSFRRVDSVTSVSMLLFQEWKDFLHNEESSVLLWHNVHVASCRQNVSKSWLYQQQL